MNTNFIKIIGLLTIALLLITACSESTIQGSGNVITESRAVSGFDRVSISGIGRVIITQGDEESLTIEADDNIMEHITSEVRDGMLELGYTDALRINTASPVVFRVNLKNLVALDNAGTASIKMDKLTTNRLEISKSGTGGIQISDLTAVELIVSADGTGKIEVTGSVDTQEVDLVGTVEYDAPDLESLTTNVNVTGTGDAVIWVLESLDVEISTAGEVNYYGSPNVTENITGVGSLNSLGDK